MRIPPPTADSPSSRPGGHEIAPAVAVRTVIGGGSVFSSVEETVGIGFVALLTAFIADRFINVQAETEAKEDLILAELRRISARRDALER